MLNETKYYCPECDEGLNLPPMRSRREFLRAIGGAAQADFGCGVLDIKAAEAAQE